MSQQSSLNCFKIVSKRRQSTQKRSSCLHPEFNLRQHDDLWLFHHLYSKRSMKQNDLSTKMTINLAKMICILQSGSFWYLEISKYNQWQEVLWASYEADGPKSFKRWPITFQKVYDRFSNLPFSTDFASKH